MAAIAGQPIKKCVMVRTAVRGASSPAIDFNQVEKSHYSTRAMMRNRGCGEVHITFFLVAPACCDSDLRREGSPAMTTQHTLTDEEFWTLLDALQTASETYMGAAVNLVLATDARVSRHFRTQADDARKLAEMVADADAITVTRRAAVKHRGH